MRTFRKRAIGLLSAYGAVGAVVACADVLGIRDFTEPGTDSGTASTTDGSSSTGSIEASSGSSGGSSGGSSSSSTSGSGSGSSSGSGGMTDASSSSSSSGSEAGSDSGPTPIIAFTGYATFYAGAAQAMSVTLPWQQSAGDLVVLLINTDPQVTISRIGDTAGNGYPQFGYSVTNGNYREAMYSCVGAKAFGANANTVTVNFSAIAHAGTCSIAVFGFTATGYAWIPDQYINNSQTNVSTLTTGSVATQYANEVLVAGTGANSEDTAGSGGDWVVETAGTFDYQEYEIVTSIQTNVAATFTQTRPSFGVSQLGTFAVTPGAHDGG